MTNDISRQAIKAVNEYAERADGNWTEVSRLIEEDLETVREWGTTGAKLYESTLRFAFNAMRPDGVPAISPP
jgi:hypothetical protein